MAKPIARTTTKSFPFKRIVLNGPTSSSISGHVRQCHRRYQLSLRSESKPQMHPARHSRSRMHGRKEQKMTKKGETVAFLFRIFAFFSAKNLRSLRGFLLTVVQMNTDNPNS